MEAILTDDMEHESRMRDALRNIAVAEPALAAQALEALNRKGVVLQGLFNDVAQAALKSGSLAVSERRKIVALIRFSEPESFDAMLRCRMSKEQLSVELPARARRAGFGEVSRYVRWVLFGAGSPDPVEAAPVTPVVEVRDNWNEAIEKAIEEVKTVGGRPRIEGIVKVLEGLKR